MRVVHLVRKVLGTLLAVACFGTALYALLRLIQGGSCASGGNYVSAHQCPPGTGTWAVALPLGIVGGLLFLGLAYIKMGGPDRLTTVMTQTLGAGSARPAAWPAHLPWPPVATDWRGATVVTMPHDAVASWSGVPAPQTPGGPAADHDPLVRLERLRALRDANALTPAEYDEAKAKILAQM